LRLAVLLLPLFFPAYLLKFDVGGVPFPLVEVFICGTFLAWILQTAHRLFRKKISFQELLQPFRQRWWLAVLGIFAAGVISTLITSQSVVMMDGNTVFYGRKVAMGILKSWIIAPILMLALFTVFMRSAKDMKIALNSYAVSAIFLAVWGIYQVLTGQYITPDARASGPFNSANYLALFIAPALFYALVQLKEFVMVSPDPWWKKISHFFWRHPRHQREKFFMALVWTGGFFLLFFGLLFAKSYAAFMAFFAACLFWGASYIRWGKKFPWKAVILGGVVLILIILALISLDPAKWQTFFQLGTRTSSGVRVEIYTIAMNLIFKYPLQGIGLGMFPAVYQLEGPGILGRDPYEWNMLHPHNVFLAFWLNLGIIGFFSFLWIIKICFQKAWKYLQTLGQIPAGSLSWFRGLGLFLLVILLVHGFVDTPFFKNDLALLFWLVVALIMLPQAGKPRS